MTLAPWKAISRAATRAASNSTACAPPSWRSALSPKPMFPRSFALTPEQAGRPLRQSAPLASPVALRFAGAALTFALAVVLVADFGGGANNGDESADGLKRAASRLGETQNLDQDAAGADAPAASRAPAESDPAAESLSGGRGQLQELSSGRWRRSGWSRWNATPLVEAPSPQPAPTTGSDGGAGAGAGPDPAVRRRVPSFRTARIRPPKQRRHIPGLRIDRRTGRSGAGRSREPEMRPLLPNRMTTAGYPRSGS